MALLSASRQLPRRILNGFQALSKEITTKANGQRGVLKLNLEKCRPMLLVDTKGQHLIDVHGGFASHSFAFNGKAHQAYESLLASSSYLQLSVMNIAGADFSTSPIESSLNGLLHHLNGDAMIDGPYSGDWATWNQTKAINYAHYLCENNVTEKRRDTINVTASAIGAFHGRGPLNMCMGPPKKMLGQNQNPEANIKLPFVYGEDASVDDIKYVVESLNDQFEILKSEGKLIREVKLECIGGEGLAYQACNSLMLFECAKWCKDNKVALNFDVVQCGVHSQSGGGQENPTALHRIINNSHYLTSDEKQWMIEEGWDSFALAKQATIGAVVMNRQGPFFSSLSDATWNKFESTVDSQCNSTSGGGERSIKAGLVMETINQFNLADAPKEFEEGIGQTLKDQLSQCPGVRNVTLHGVFCGIQFNSKKDQERFGTYLGNNDVFSLDVSDHGNVHGKRFVFPIDTTREPEAMRRVNELIKITRDYKGHQ